jgi:hypothetical protein
MAPVAALGNDWLRRSRNAREDTFHAIIVYNQSSLYQTPDASDDNIGLLALAPSHGHRPVSYDRWRDGGLTPLEHAAGVWDILHGRKGDDPYEDGPDFLVRAEERELRRSQIHAARPLSIQNSARFNEASKMIAGMRDKKLVQTTLIEKVHEQQLDAAIVRYMSDERLPEFYATILKTPKCLDRLIEGILFKVCHVPPSLALAEQIDHLRSRVRTNTELLSAYERVAWVRQFIYKIVDNFFGTGSAYLIPVRPMRQALSAARLHLGIVDTMERHAAYTACIDQRANTAADREVANPAILALPLGKKFYPHWRRRHLRPLSHFYTEEDRVRIRTLVELDHGLPDADFLEAAALAFAGSCSA